jgi:hypothetical protein
VTAISTVSPSSTGSAEVDLEPREDHCCRRRRPSGERKADARLLDEVA